MSDANSEYDDRYDAMRRLGQRRAVEAVPTLIAALSDPSVMYRLAAREALLSIADPRGFAALLALPDLGFDGRDRLVRTAIEESDPARAVALLAVILRAEGPLLRLKRKMAAKRLRQLGGPDALALLREAAADPDDGFRAFVQDCIARFPDPPAPTPE